MGDSFNLKLGKINPSPWKGDLLPRNDFSSLPSRETGCLISKLLKFSEMTFTCRGAKGTKSISFFFHHLWKAQPELQILCPDLAKLHVMYFYHLNKHVL